MRRFVFPIFIGALLSWAVTAPAIAQQQVLVVLPDSQTGDGQPMNVFWKVSRGAANEDNVIGARRVELQIPHDFFVGTARPAGGGTLRTWTLHNWRIDRGFMQEADVTTGLRLARKPDNIHCFHAKDISRMAQSYDDRLSTNELLSAIIMFGHLYEVCKSKGMGDNAEAASRAVLRLYRSMNALNSFKGQMCISGGAGRACG